MKKSIGSRLAYLSTQIGMKIGCAAARIAPRRFLYLLAEALAWIGFRCFTGFRRRSIRNINLLLGSEVDSDTAGLLAQRSLRNFFFDCVEIALALVASDESIRREIAVVGREHLDAALARGKGVMVLSAHFGNFFLIGCRLAIEGYPTSVMVNQPRDGQFAKIRELNGVLRRNQIAVVISDEFRKGDGARVNFFGKTVIARRGPATLALRTKAAIIPAAMVRQPDDSLKLVIEPALNLVQSARPKEAIKINTQRMVAWLEATIRSQPDQWNWMNLRWWEPAPANNNENQ